MSQHLIQQYLNQLKDLRKVSGSNRESVVREAFKDLLKGWARSLDLVFIPEYEIKTPAKERRYVDGALLYSLRIPFGFWEAKDENDDLDTEIQNKFRRGYPQSNIIFEDSQKAILIQNKQEIARCAVDDVSKLEQLLQQFFAYERPEIAAFRKAVEQFTVDLPAVLKSLREMIEEAEKTNKGFSKAASEFLKHIKDAINPSLTAADVREMLIQHILTEEVFASVFPNSPFHQDNNVARELYKLEKTFFTGDRKFQSLKALSPYYTAIRAAASQIERHNEKQTFLKVIYENFYKVYNVKAADRLGVVYTPNEIVRFMMESTDWLCEKHFGRNLIDKDVDILDPATGTGTFVCEILEHFRGQPEKLKHKYLNELHANEVAILPYYVANLNIEATYAAITGSYEEYPGLCFVDTLDNTFALRKHKGHQEDLFGISDDNIKRIRQQNSKRISVIIGNPPYNANQANENENNKNREYPEIDKRIKETYIKASTAQKTKLYDMYARFFRWASDRLDENGVLALITNRSFIESRTFDGFRKMVAEEFNEIRMIDLGGDVRANPKLSGTKHNVFGIQTGVAISFMVKKAKTKGCKIYYNRRPEFDTAEDKLEFLQNAKLRDLTFDEIHADKKHNWVNLTDNDFETFLPIASKETKNAKKASQEKAIFKLFSLGVVTNRDEWVYDNSAESLDKKVNFLIDAYNADLKKLKHVKNKKDISEQLDGSIKWTRAVKNDLKKGVVYQFDGDLIVESLYRPYSKRHLYFSKQLNEMHYQMPAIFPEDIAWDNRLICFTTGGRLPFHSFSTSIIPSLTVLSLDANQCLPRWVYIEGQKIDNITDWSLKQFKEHYQDKKLTKDAIFNYVYGILHDPIYREKYALNLKREFPHIPFYPDFHQWAAWGKQLMDLHIDYEQVAPYKLQKVEAADKKGNKIEKPECKLKADKDNGCILLDTQTSLIGIPKAAWDYKLGNRSALEWILDQYKESKPKDPTIREKFNNYRFSDYKEQVIDLLMRVTTVSVETMKIIEQIKQAKRNS